MRSATQITHNRSRPHLGLDEPHQHLVAGVVQPAEVVGEQRARRRRVRGGRGVAAQRREDLARAAVGAAGAQQAVGVGGRSGARGAGRGFRYGVKSGRRQWCRPPGNKVNRLGANGAKHISTAHVAGSGTVDTASSGASAHAASVARRGSARASDASAPASAAASGEAPSRVTRSRRTKGASSAAWPSSNLSLANAPTLSRPTRSSAAAARGVSTAAASAERKASAPGARAAFDVRRGGKGRCAEQRVAG